MADTWGLATLAVMIKLGGHAEWMSQTPSPGARLAENELQQLAILLARYGTHDLDPWDLWRVETPRGWPEMSGGRCMCDASSRRCAVHL
jgi:hypothetical protein